MQSADNALKGEPPRPLVLISSDRLIRRARAAHLAIRLKIADYVLLGGCHDGGYADYLHQPGSTHSLNRIGLLKTSTVHSTKFESFGLEWVDWTDLFVRCSPLADSRYDVIKGVRGKLDPDHGASCKAQADRPFLGAVPRAHPNKTFAAAGTTEQTGVDPHSTLASLAPTSLTSTAPEQFQPLLAVLTSLREAGQHQPFQALVVEELRRRYHTFLYTRFDEYANDAERLGLVQLGRGAAEGTEWIRLVSITSLFDTFQKLTSPSAAPPPFGKIHPRSLPPPHQTPSQTISPATRRTWCPHGGSRRATGTSHLRSSRGVSSQRIRPGGRAARTRQVDGRQSGRRRVGYSHLLKVWEQGGSILSV